MMAMGAEHSRQGVQQAQETAASRCQEWNVDHAHQVQAGKARAQQFTPAYQQQAGEASFAAFSARWRAEQGLAPLSAEAVRKYVSPEQIGHVARVVPPELQQCIHRAWCAGALNGVDWWLYHPDWAAALEEQLDRAARGWAQHTLLDTPHLADVRDWPDGPLTCGREGGDHAG
jgi:hypothetical protein